MSLAVGMVSRRRAALFSRFLCAAALVGAFAITSPAAAQMAVPSNLPVLSGRVLQYSLTGRGDVDGLLLDDGTEVHLPPHLGPQLVAAIRPGDTVEIRGLRARAVPIVEAVEITDRTTGRRVVDSAGPGGPPAAPLFDGPAGELRAAGTVRAPLHGPRGDLNGALLSDGTIVRLPPGEAARLAATLKPGTPLVVEGRGWAGPLGRVIAASRIGPSGDALHAIGGPGPGPDRPGPIPPGPSLGGPSRP